MDEVQPIDAAPSRLVELDVLRGLAVLLVLGRHVIDIPDTLPTPILAFFKLWREMGWIGVDLFFVLSGFLVSGLLFSEYKKTGKLRPIRFLTRRGLKIYPPFYVLFLVSIIGWYSIHVPRNLSTRSVLAEALFLQNYLNGFWGHTWSLAVEEHFYIMLTILLVILTKVRWRSTEPFAILPGLICFCCISVLALRLIIAQKNPAGWWQDVIPFTHTRIDALFFGVLFSYLYHFRTSSFFTVTEPWLWPLALSVPLTFALPIFFPLNESRFIYSFGLSLLSLGFSALLLLCLHPAISRKTQFVKKLTSVAFIGKYSYSIYLWHLPIYFIALLFLPASDLSPTTFYLRTFSYLTSSIVMGAFMAKLIEVPVLRFRDRFYPSPCITPKQSIISDEKTELLIANNR